MTGGKRYTKNGCDKGYFMEPTILVTDKPDCRVCQEEIFGPVVVVQKFKTADESSRWPMIACTASVARYSPRISIQP